jgi:hypothetical protein
VKVSSAALGSASIYWLSLARAGEPLSFVLLHGVEYL